MIVHHILDALFRNEPFACSKNINDDAGIFVSQHDDLNFQSIFCDSETEEVTGIIDWDWCWRRWQVHR
jgi:hypothetical protein